MKARIVTPEILDGLPNSDPSAQRSRRDLRRIHRAMGSGRLIAGTLRATKLASRDSATLRILEIGAGDGHLMLDVARRLHPQWPRVELTLLDRLDLVDRSTLSAYASLGWTTQPLVADVLDWAAEMAAKPLRDAAGHWDLVIANLFLHHFKAVPLSALLAAIETCTTCFVAYEPRRSWVAQAGSHLVGAIGANAVTRTDAILSVAAGFRDSEIGELWPTHPDRWALTEYAAGPFSHCFVAERIPGPPPAHHATLI